MRYIPQQAIAIISQFEGLRLHAYMDIAGIWTIGYGHVILPHEDFTGGITPQEAADLLRNDMQSAAASIARLITRPLTNSQYSSILSFTYNLGAGTLQRSTLRKKCNRGEDDDVPAEFVKYCYAGGKKSLGLLRRRSAEAQLYMRGD